MTNRRTSVYTIRVRSQEAAQRVVAGFNEQGLGIQDQGETSVSFRAPGDAAALLIARQAQPWARETVTLTTGLGVHRREVTA